MLRRTDRMRYIAPDIAAFVPRGIRRSVSEVRLPHRRVRFIALFVAVFAAPAQACSDLPNICAQMAQHHNEMIDIAATPPPPEWWGDEPYGDDAPEPYYDPTAFYLDHAIVASRRVALEALQRTLDGPTVEDPKSRAYRDGTWQFFQDKIAAEPGEYCAALFWRKDGFVRLSGPGSDFDGAMMTFWSEKIPRPEAVRRIAVTLAQSGDDPPQTVQTFNYMQRGQAYGAIAFAVPTFDALLDNIEDAHWFELSIDGETVARVEWTGGHAARDELRRCAAARKPARR